MRYLIVLEQTEDGFAIQVPDLAISTHAENINAAKQAALDAIRVNLEAYQEAGQQVPAEQPVSTHLENPDFKDLLFAFIDITRPTERIAA